MEPAGLPVAVLGHSLGGVVALALGSGWFGVTPTVVAGLGIKVRWTDEELGKAAELAARPPKVFADRDAAVDRALKVAGLSGLGSPDQGLPGRRWPPPTAGTGPPSTPPAFAVGAPDMDGYLRVARNGWPCCRTDDNKFTRRLHMCNVPANASGSLAATDQPPERKKGRSGIQGRVHLD